MQIRASFPEDRAGVAAVCIATGWHGEDAAGRYAAPELLPAVYADPYLVRCPDLAWVVEHDGAVAGYLLGAADTRGFEAWCEDSWWPALRERFPLSATTPAPDAELIRHIHHPPATAASVVADHPAHLHIDLLPFAQGLGLGRLLIETLLSALRERRVPGVHLGVSPLNTGAIVFYRHLGFAELAVPGRLVLGLRLR